MSGLTAYAGGLAAIEPGEGRTRGRIFAGNREEWCNEIVAAMLPMLAVHGITFPDERQVRCAVTAGLKRTSLGLCHSAKSSTDGRTNFIDVSTAQAEPMDLAHTLLHELLHACDDCHSGHRGRWKRWAGIVGIQSKGHARGPVAQAILDAALERVGVPGQHVPSITQKALRRISQIKFWCPDHHGHVHMPTLQAVDGFRVGCAACGQLMVCDEVQLARATGKA